jgi:pantoate--beta-alanine ligase
MRVIRTKQEMRQWRRGVAGSVGLVPTMGALHEGHLALVNEAKRRSDTSVVSIFVNPRQFSEESDFSAYPRTLDRDVSLLRDAGVDVLLVPDPEEIYPKRILIDISVPALSDRLEGAARPGHFSGVCLVVCKLLNIVQPDLACFGRKDGQQLIIIQQMVQDLDLPVQIVPVETVRDKDGVALSSRNALLTSEEREAARSIPTGLFAARDRYLAGERCAEALKMIVKGYFDEETAIEVDYVSLASVEGLEELDLLDHPAMLSIAVNCGDVRLIDNVILE